MIELWVDAGGKGRWAHLWGSAIRGLGAVLFWFATVGFVIGAIMAVESIAFGSTINPEADLGPVVFGSLLGAAVLAASALKLADLLLKRLVQFVMWVCVCVDAILLYVVFRLWYAGAPWLPESARTTGSVVVVIFFLFIMNVFVAAVFLPLLRTAGIDPDDVL